MTLDQALQELRKFYKLHKRLPSYQEMAELFGYASKNASYYLVQKLIDLDMLAKEATGKLTLGPKFFAIPVLGHIKAGNPDEAYQQFLDAVSLDQYLIDNPFASYALKVSGDSMIEAGIHPNDIVIVEKNRSPRNGDIVVANIDNEFTLKYFRRDNGVVCLVPANSKYHPFFPKESLSIFGVVTSVIRKYH